MQADREGFETAVIRATASHHKVAFQVTVRAPVPPAMLDGGDLHTSTFHLKLSPSSH